MISVVIGFANIFRTLGFESALIQKHDAQQEHYCSIFWINVASGLMLMFLFVAVSPLLGRFYNQPVLVPLTVLISVNFFVGSLNVVQTALAKRRMDFRRLTVIELVALSVSGVIGILMAHLGMGVWGLAWMSVITTSVTAILLWLGSDWRPAFRFNWMAVKSLLRFSSNLLAFESMNYWLRNGDNLLVGKFLGTLALGIYSKSYMILLFPLITVSRTISRVMFPALSSIQKDKQRVGRVYLRMNRTVALLTFPMAFGLWVVAEHFVLAVFGSQWAQMIPILKIFSLLSLIQSIVTLSGTLYQSQGRTDLQFKIGALSSILGIGAIILGLRWGILGVAYTLTISSLLTAYPGINRALALVDLTFLTLVKALFATWLCALLMAILVWGIGLLLPSGLPHSLYLLVQISVGMTIYGALIHLCRVEAYRDIRTLLLEQARPQAGTLSVVGRINR